MVRRLIATLCQFMCKRNIFFRKQVRRAHVIYFWQRAPSTSQTQPKKNPSIIVRHNALWKYFLSDRQKLRCVFLLLIWEDVAGWSGRVVGQGLFQRSMFIFIYFAFVGSLCKYSLNSVIAIFIETERVLKSHRAALTIMWHQVSIMINYTRRDNSK